MTAAAIRKQAATARIADLPRELRSERREVTEFLEAGIDFTARQSAEPVDAEFLAAEAAHHRAVNHRTADFVVIGPGIFQINPLSRKVTHESAGETIARSGGIENVFEQVAGNHEVPVAPPEDRAVFSALDDQRVRSHAEDLPGGFLQVRFAGEHTGFAVIDQQEIPF